jgi:S-(hydroxymethyl)glutathione dehydrogenase / alcohol dehydrogenase
MALEDLTLDEPRLGEVLVRVVAVGVCHTDVHAFRGDPAPPLPVVLGHEGAGIVEAVGPGVVTVSLGDHVVLSAVPRCGWCEQCVVGRPQLCQVAQPTLWSGTLLDGTRRLRRGDEPVHHFFAQSSFAEYAVVPQGATVRIPRDVPLELVAPLACGVSTGLSSVLNAARVKVGATVAVVGCGGVGVSAIIGAHLAHASTVIAVDVVDAKLELACDVGATHAVNAAREQPVERVRELTAGRGVDYAFECVGSSRTQEQVVQMIAVGGSGYLVGGAPVRNRFSFPTDRFLQGKSVYGVAAGDIRAAIDIPRYVELYQRGKLPLERLVTRRYRLEEINAAFAALQDTVGRSVITMG